MVTNQALNQYLNEFLAVDRIKDYAPNGLQVEGRAEINKIMTSVTASLDAIEAAMDWGADALLVHHGYFWKNEPAVLCGMKQRRIKQLLMSDMNLFGYHLPLDVHEQLGNNVMLAKQVGWDVRGNLPSDIPGLVWHGAVAPCDADDFGANLSDKLGRDPLHIAPRGSRQISTIAWCTGGAQDYIDTAIAAGVDAYISGEISERTVHIARESGIHYFSAGHHATERYGVQALAGHLAEHDDLLHEYYDIHNPV